MFNSFYVLYRFLLRSPLFANSNLCLPVSRQHILSPTWQILANAPEIKLSKDESSIEFDQVSFGYDKEKKILDELSLSVASGERVGIVGGSGSGKSTIIRLMYRSDCCCLAAVVAVR